MLRFARNDELNKVPFKSDPNVAVVGFFRSAILWARNFRPVSGSVEVNESGCPSVSHGAQDRQARPSVPAPLIRNLLSEQGKQFALSRQIDSGLAETSAQIPVDAFIRRAKLVVLIAAGVLAAY